MKRSGEDEMGRFEVLTECLPATTVVVWPNGG
jgi:hypothetical protein